jgi:hypothetical protein
MYMNSGQQEKDIISLLLCDTLQWILMDPIAADISQQYRVN